MNPSLLLSASLLALSVSQSVYSSQSTQYTYNDLGLVTSIDGSRTDVADITTYEYNALGQRSAIINALGHRTEMSYDAQGRAIQWQDANGLITQVAYNNDGYLSESSVAGRTTQYTYDAVGNLVGMVAPNGSWLYYQYDDARRLIQIEDTLGNTITYTRDLAGNATSQQIQDSSGQLVHNQQQLFDAMGRLMESINGVGNSDKVSYDNNSNLTAITDAKNQSTQNAYDALNRLITQTDPLNQHAQYGYDSDDNLIEVTDPKGLVTRYTYDAYGNRISQDSPDTGLTTYIYDSADNLSSQTDAKGITTTYTYDALNRLTQITYPDSAYNIAYTYDQGNNGIGKLSSIQDGSGTTAYSYTAQGDLNTVSQVIDGQTYTTQFAYNTAGQLISMTYPSGKTLSYSYNALGQIQQMDLTDQGQVTPLMNNALHLPFGGLTQLQYGNGHTLTQDFDLAYQMTQQQVTWDDGQTQATHLDINYSFDPVGNITQITDVIATDNSHDFNYDALSRLTSAQSPINTLLYSYDADGNRLSLDINGQVQEYLYGSSNNHLNQINGSLADILSYDANGNVIQSDTRTFSYGDNNRLIQVQEGGQVLADYRYNAFGQRAIKATAESTTHYLYDTNGNLIAEHNALGEVVREYIYLNGQRLVLVQQGGDGVTLAEVILDNSDSSTVVTGDWNTSTAVAGFQGENYQFHAANGASPDGLVVDNSDVAFSTSGNWTTSTSVAGFQGENYQYHEANGASPDGMVIDNSDVAFNTTGDWTASTSVVGFQGENYQYHEANGASPDGMVIDNSDAAFSTTGDWTTSTSVSGFNGANYQYHAANGASLDGIVVDNSDATFSTTGSWTSSTSVSGFNGANYQFHAANGASPDGLELDNSDSSVTTIGSWNHSASSSGYLGANYQYMAAGSGNNSLTWHADISIAGDYHVYARWTASSNRASNAPYTIVHANGSDTVTANQQQQGGQWNLLGTYTFNAGPSSVSLSDNADAYVIADGIKIVPINAAPNTATWAVNVPEAGDYTIYGRWTSGSNRASNAQYCVTHANGETTATLNQQQNGGLWNAIGTFSFEAGTTTVQLTDVADGYVIADAIKLVSVNAPPDKANWTVDIPEDGNYKIYARWSAGSNRASNAAYTVNHANGETTSTLNQQQNGGQWNLIGAYDFTAGQTQVSLTDVADGYVIADAIKVVSSTAPPNSANWTITIPEEGNYSLYARWSAGSNRASNATYTVNHANGETTVNLNQQQNGGQWNLIGAYDFIAGNTQVSLTDQADGYVIADAIKVVSSTAPPNSANWTITIPEDGNYNLYARWSAGSNRASNAAYTVNHANGETTTPLNQQQNGGQWNLIGSYDFTAGQTQVSLTDVADGYVIADAIKLVPTANQVTTSGGIYYIHTDHLDTPKLLTDASGQVVWSSTHAPFGSMTVNEDVDGNGENVTLNFRFPGQYYDSETGLYYNYFRYYDPSLGRYITSDPIGLAGGMNTYAYVEGNPVTFYDPYGLRLVASPPILEGGIPGSRPSGGGVIGGPPIGRPTIRPSRPGLGPFPGNIDLNEPTTLPNSPADTGTSIDGACVQKCRAGFKDYKDKECSKATTSAELKACVIRAAEILKRCLPKCKKEPQACLDNNSPVTL